MKRQIPLKRDPGRTRATLLAEATKIFARSGYHGASLSDILKKAKINKRMIYHYFGSKEELYREVHLQGWKELQEWFLKELSRSDLKNASPIEDKDLLMESLKIFHDFIASHQLFLRLLVWDGLEGGQVSRSLWKDIRGPIYRQLEFLVQDAQTKGVLDVDLKASHLIISFMGVVAFYYAHAHTMVDIFQKNTLGREAIEERKEQILLLFRKIIKV